ncbi:MAG: hypothetical protein RBT68_04440 [Spirochaetia bacterium]|nr:hypothetical protein [Spirochaetia bacterium]
MRTRSAFAALSVFFIVLLGACSEQDTVSPLQREQLFNLGYGVLEDQVNLFSIEGQAPSLKTRIAMRDGIFFVSNGNASKIMAFSSFGDLLMMIYNPDSNPEPVILKPAALDAPSQGRVARTYPLNAPGFIAVDSRRTIFVEDRVPESRVMYDPELNASLEYVVLRFSRDGEFLDYLGQEGIGGTPFPLIAGIYITEADECAVVTMSGEGWSVYWFDRSGFLVSNVMVRRSALPLPEKADGLIASFDGIVPSPDGQGLLVKIDYFREIIDQETRTKAGIEFVNSLVWRMDHLDGEYLETYELPPFESMSAIRSGDEVVPRSWDFGGAAAGNIYFSAVDEDGQTYYALYEMTARSMRRFALGIEADELRYVTFSLAPEGILSALLGSSYEARIVWWRFDKLAGGLVR